MWKEFQEQGNAVLLEKSGKLHRDENTTLCSEYDARCTPDIHDVVF